MRSPFDNAAVVVQTPGVEGALLDTEEGSDAIRKAMTKGLPVFRMVDGQPEFLDGCSYPGDFTFEFNPSATQSESISNSMFEANAYKSVVKAAFARQSRKSLIFKRFGRWSSSVEHPSKADLQDNCSGATHVATAVDVGAFEVREDAVTGGGASIGAGPVGAGGGHNQSYSVILSVGELPNCKIQGQLTAPPTEAPYLCNAPIGVNLVALEAAAKLTYHFDDRVVVAARSKDAAITTAELEHLAHDLQQALVERGKANNIDVEMLLAPEETKINCSVTAAIDAKHYNLQCAKGEHMILQHSNEHATLSSSIPDVASQLIARVDPTEVVKNDWHVGRMVLLVDISKSMVINDASTFLSEDTRYSNRYQIVETILDGLILNGINPDVGVVVFAGPGCAYPLSHGGRDLWRLTEGSRDQALEWMEKNLEVARCSEGTDLTGALRSATKLLGQYPKSTAGHDAVILITDGSHQASTTATPKTAASELRAAEATLHVVRVQLNDLRGLRAELGGPNKQTILDRWERFTGESYRKDWESEVENIPRQDDAGTALIKDLMGVEISNFILSLDDESSDPLLMVHEYLLPALGAIGTVEAKGCEDPRQRSQDDGSRTWQMVCDLYVPLGRPVNVQISPPKCMEDVVRARIQIPDLPIDLKPTRKAGSTVIFERATIGQPRKDGTTIMVDATLTLRSQMNPSVPCD